MASHLSIDALTIRNGRVFGWGWFLDTDATLEAATLELPLIGGDSTTVACLDGGTRADFAAVFPDVTHAANTGFMIMAQVPGNVDLAGNVRFAARLRDGRTYEVTLPLADLPRSGASRRGIGDVLARLRRDGIAAVGLAALRRAGDAARAMASWCVRAGLQWRRRPVTVLFDHALGGGANVFRDARIGTLLGQGRTVLRISPDVTNLDYVLSLVRPGDRVLQWHVPTLDAVFEALSRFRIASVEINNLVSFDDPLRIASWCADRRAAGSELVFYLHDFHAVCPAFTLIDADGRYCGVPSPAACAGCLPRNAANLLGFPAPADTREWREGWSAMLLAADRIVAFSDASARILGRAYPELDGRLRIDLQPHRPDHSHLRAVRAVRPAASGGITVGVIGNISRAKGSEIVHSLAQIAESRGLDLRIVVIGTLQASGAANSCLQVHGAFAADELPDLLERYGIDVCLMPSVCPETYSYVTDEIMAMGMPLVVFDIGAPAERVARYTSGIVTKEITAEAALADIMRLAERGLVPFEPGVREPR